MNRSPARAFGWPGPRPARRRFLPIRPADGMRGRGADEGDAGADLSRSGRIGARPPLPASGGGCAQHAVTCSRTCMSGRAVQQCVTAGPRGVRTRRLPRTESSRDAFHRVWRSARILYGCNVGTRAVYPSLCPKVARPARRRGPATGPAGGVPVPTALPTSGKEPLWLLRAPIRSPLSKASRS